MILFDKNILVLHILILLSNLNYILCQPCPNSCNSHGNCNSGTRICECFDGKLLN